MDQKIGQLSPDDTGHLDRQREWVRDHYDPAAQHKFDTIEGKLRLIETIVRERWVEPEERWKLQSLGVALGDAIAQRMAMEWVLVEDEYGRTPALNDPGTTILLFPLTMISKRIERGEAVDVAALFDGVCEMLKKPRSENDQSPA